jgi:hypothetical protein
MQITIGNKQATVNSIKFYELGLSEFNFFESIEAYLKRIGVKVDFINKNYVKEYIEFEYLEDKGGF